MTHFRLMLCGITMLSLFSCDNRDYERTDLRNYPSDGIIRVHAENESFTRGGYDTGTLKEFRLFVTNSVSPNHTYQNVQMRKENGEFVAYKDGTPLTMQWQNSFDSVDVVAITGRMADVDKPFSVSDVNKPFSVSVLAEQSTNSAIEESDFLYYRKSGFIPESDLVNGKIQLLFSHMCAKLRVTLNLSKIGASTVNPVKHIQVEGIVLERMFNPMTAQWEGSSASTASAIIPFMVSYSYSANDAIAVYDCILVPQKVSLNGLVVNVVVEEKNYNYAVPEEVLFHSGTLYNLSVTVDN